MLDEPKREESEMCAQIAEKEKEKKSDRHEWYEFVRLVMF